MSTVIVNYLIVFRIQILEIVSKLPKTFINFNLNQYYGIEIYSVYFSLLFRSIQNNILFYTLSVNDLENVSLFFTIFLDEYFDYLQNYFIITKNSDAVNYLLSITTVMKSLILELASCIQNYKSDGTIISISQNDNLNSRISTIKKVLIRSDPLEYSHIYSEISDSAQSSNSNPINNSSNILNQLLYVQTFFDEQEPPLYCKNILIQSYKPFSVIKNITDLIPKHPQKNIQLLSKCKNIYDLPPLPNFCGEKQYMFVLAEYSKKEDDFSFSSIAKGMIGLLVHADKWKENVSKWFVHNYTLIDKPFQKKVFIVS